MARYIDADKIDYKVIMVGQDEYAGYRSVAFESDIDEMPTADVVPKSEVASILDELMTEVRKIADRYEKSAKETSDLIFERIEYRGTQIGAMLAVFKIAELKKKYTEGNDHD